MYLLRATYFRKTVAIVFLVLFVLVHAIKALHTHEISIAYSHHHADKHNTNLKADFFCSICDFQVAKDADAIRCSIETAIPQQKSLFVDTYFLSAYSSTIIISSGTDPPFFA